MDVGKNSQYFLENLVQSRQSCISTQLESLVLSDPSLGKKAALIYEDGRTVTYGQLIHLYTKPTPPKFLVREAFQFFIFSRTVDCVILYLNLLWSKASFAILPEGMTKEALESLASSYKPANVIGTKQELTRLGLPIENTWGELASVNPGVNWQPLDFHPPQILMGTSGTTGSAKQVRLSPGHLAANARDISKRLTITGDDVALSILPFSYSYGLSVLNSHLWSGAAIVCSDVSPVSPGFIELLQQRKVSSLTGVPFNYEMYSRLNLYERLPASVRYFTQAGGALPSNQVAEVSRSLAKFGVDFFPMYGQTEATARISILQSDLVRDFPDSVGTAIPSGAVSIGSQNHPEELVFEGPNTMYGYSTCQSDLLLPDTNLGRLETGDLAKLDTNGLIFLKGRLKRIAKVNGVRLNLSEIETKLSQFAQAAVVEDANTVLIFTELEPDKFTLINDSLDKLGMQRRDYKVIGISELPRTSSGKIDYTQLTGM